MTKHAERIMFRVALAVAAAALLFAVAALLEGVR